MKLRTNTQERRVLPRARDRRKQGGLESALPWVLTFAALVFFIFAAIARAEDSRTLTVHRVLAVAGNPLNDLTALEKVKFVMKAGRPVDRNSL